MQYVKLNRNHKLGVLQLERGEIVGVHPKCAKQLIADGIAVASSRDEKYEGAAQNENQPEHKD